MNHRRDREREAERADYLRVLLIARGRKPSRLSSQEGIDGDALQLIAEMHRAVGLPTGSLERIRTAVAGIVDSLPAAPEFTDPWFNGWDRIRGRR